MIKSKVEFEEANIICKSIIDKYDIFSDMPLWLKEQKSLFNQINIQPKGLPGIANSYFEGVKYEFISKFHQLYKKVYHDYNILNERSHLESIIYFLEDMNSYMLGHYLDSDIIMNYESPTFYYLLGMAFDELQKRGNYKLQVKKMYCKNGHEDYYFFLGNKDSSYLQLQFKIENGIVRDIFEYELFKFDEPLNLDTTKRISIQNL
jgi:hypothetical protein